MESINDCLGDKNAHAQAQTHRLSHAGKLFSWDHPPAWLKSWEDLPFLREHLDKKLLGWLVKTFKKSKCLSWPSLSCQFLANCITAGHHLCPSTEILLSKKDFQEKKKLKKRQKKEHVLLWDEETKGFLVYIRKYILQEGKSYLYTSQAMCLWIFSYVYVYVYLHIYV